MGDSQGSRDYLRYLSLGVEIAGTLILPIGIGFWIDSFWDTSPWFLLGGAIIGVLLFFGLLLRLSRSQSKP
ncbi:MAG: AtpZ/AtpI family protein [Balneolaceae bacterium]